MNDIKKSRNISSEKDIKKAYSKLSRIYGFFEGFFERKLRKRSLELLNIKPSNKILEIAFGTGHNLVDFGKIINDKGKIYGVDLTPEMIEKSRNRLKKNNLLDKVKLFQGNAKKLPFKNNSFEVVYISNAIELFSDNDIMIVLNEIHRVLKSNGKVCVIDTSNNEKYKIVKFYKWLNKKFPSYTSSPIDINSFVKNAGFKIIYEDQIKLFGFFPENIVIAKR